jgi:hypothetical protein
MSGPRYTAKVKWLAGIMAKDGSGYIAPCLPPDQQSTNTWPDNCVPFVGSLRVYELAENEQEPAVGAPYVWACTVHVDPWYPTDVELEAFVGMCSRPQQVAIGALFGGLDYSNVIWHRGSDKRRHEVSLRRWWKPNGDPDPMLNFIPGNSQAIETFKKYLDKMQSTESDSQQPGVS